jgi:hypothetical protein
MNTNKEDVEMVNYSLLSDFEINELIARIFGLRNVSRKSDEISGSAIQFNDYVKLPYCGYGNIEYQDRVYIADYCNKPQDAFPIMDENRISLFYDYANFGECTAHSGEERGANYEFEFSHKNPLRAAMIVFLMMKERK